MRILPNLIFESAGSSHKIQTGCADYLYIEGGCWNSPGAGGTPDYIHLVFLNTEGCYGTGKKFWVCSGQPLFKCLRNSDFTTHTDPQALQFHFVSNNSTLEFMVVTIQRPKYSAGCVQQLARISKINYLSRFIV